MPPSLHGGLSSESIPACSENAFQQNEVTGEQCHTPAPAWALGFGDEQPGKSGIAVPAELSYN